MKYAMFTIAAAALLAGSSAIALAQTNSMGTNSNMGTNSGMTAPSTAAQPGAENSNSNGTTGAMSSAHGHMAMSATRVKRIQSALDQKGEHVTVDGKWGKQTAAAVRSFQKENGLPTTGRADHQTMQKLGVSG